jgi:hypothetical protein
VEPNVSIESLAAAWAGLWAGGALPGDLYREDVLFWPVELAPTASGVGPAAVQEYVGRVLATVAEPAVDVYRAFGSAREVVVEAILSGVDAADGGVRKGTGVCAIFDLDREGRISREQLHLQWRGRREDDGQLRPRIPEQDGIDRGSAFWLDFAHRQLDPWGSPDADPDGMVDAVYDEDDYVLDSMIGKQPVRLLGREALRAAERQLLEHLPIRETYVARIVHGGNAAAVWHPVLARTSTTSAASAFSSLMVLTVNDRGRCISEHTYLPAAWPATVPA